MSYYMCNRITIKKGTNQIFVNVTSNNVSPHTYSKCEYAEKSNYTLDEKLRFLMISMLEGNIQISQINKNTIPYEYALIKIREYYKSNSINHYEERFEKQREIFNERISQYSDPNDWKTYKEFCKNNKELVDKIESKVASELYLKEFEIFKNSINEKIEGEFYLSDKNDTIIEFCGKTKFGFKYRAYDLLDENCLLDYKLAYIRQNYMGDKFTIKKVEKLQNNKTNDEIMEDEEDEEEF